MHAFIDAHRTDDVVEPICRVLEIAPSAHYVYRQRQTETSRRSARAQRDAVLQADIARIYRANHAVDGVRKVWRPLQREGTIVARCYGGAPDARGRAAGRYARSSRAHTHPDPAGGGVGGSCAATVPRGLADPALGCRLHLRRDVAWFRVRRLRDRCLLAPHLRLAGAYDDAHRAVLDAFEQVLHDREFDGPLIVHTYRGSHYVSMRYMERVLAASAAPSVGSLGDAYDNALAESVIGLYTTEVIRRRGPWRGFEGVEYATLERVAWFNAKRLLEPLGYIPPAEFEKHYHRTQATHTECLIVN